MNSTNTTENAKQTTNIKKEDRVWMKYIPVRPNERANNIKVMCYYSMGGMNYFTYKNEARGYYLSMTPVHKSENCESFTAFSGVKTLIKAASRFNKREAEQVFSEHINNPIVEEWMKNNDFVKED